jgi:hypothetical protein
MWRTTIQSKGVSQTATLAEIAGGSGGLPTRTTRPGLGAPKARRPPRLGGPKVGGPQGLPAQSKLSWGAFKRLNQ